MSTAGTARTATEGGDLAEQRVTPLELFFDLVFVFALTQVTGFLTDHLTWTGMLQGTALLAVLCGADIGRRPLRHGAGIPYRLDRLVIAALVRRTVGGRPSTARA